MYEGYTVNWRFQVYTLQELRSSALYYVLNSGCSCLVFDLPENTQATICAFTHLANIDKCARLLEQEGVKLRVILYAQCTFFWGGVHIAKIGNCPSSGFDVLAPTVFVIRFE